MAGRGLYAENLRERCIRFLGAVFGGCGSGWLGVVDAGIGVMLCLRRSLCAVMIVRDGVLGILSAHDPCAALSPENG